ncbi:MAG: Uncharacterised protein [Prochlorococcus marinus str. MIT 9215]|nr:MAG: Uncharacterised protein [Prochlorococcus marinus str. MIT 9215]
MAIPATIGIKPEASLAGQPLQQLQQERSLQTIRHRSHLPLDSDGISAQRGPRQHSIQLHQHGFPGWQQDR